MRVHSDGFLFPRIMRSQQQLATVAVNSEREALANEISELNEVRKMLQNPCLCSLESL